MSREVQISREFGNMLKFVSSLLVAFCHYGTYRVIDCHDGGIMYKMAESLGGYLGVALFFLLSGYGLMESDRKRHLDFVPYCKRRLSRVYLPTMLVTLIWVLVAQYLNLFDCSSVGHLLYVILWDYDDGALWFIRIILLLYLSFYLFSYLYRRRRREAHLVFILFVGMIYIYSHLSNGAWSALSVPLFYIGMLLSLNKNNPVKGVILPLFDMGAFTCSVSYLFGGRYLLVHAFINYAFILLFLLLLPIFSEKLPSFRHSAMLGNFSFDLYLVHNKIIYVMMKSMNYIPAGLWISVTLLTAYLFFIFRKRILEE